MLENESPNGSSSESWAASAIHRRCSVGDPRNESAPRWYCFNDLRLLDNVLAVACNMTSGYKRVSTWSRLRANVNESALRSGSLSPIAVRSCSKHFTQGINWARTSVICTVRYARNVVKQQKTNRTFCCQQLTLRQWWRLVAIKKIIGQVWNTGTTYEYV